VGHRVWGEMKSPRHHTLLTLCFRVLFPSTPGEGVRQGAVGGWGRWWLAPPPPGLQEAGAAYLSGTVQVLGVETPGEGRGEGKDNKRGWWWRGAVAYGIVHHAARAGNAKKQLRQRPLRSKKNRPKKSPWGIHCASKTARASCVGPRAIFFPHAPKRAAGEGRGQLRGEGCRLFEFF